MGRNQKTIDALALLHKNELKHEHRHYPCESTPTPTPTPSTTPTPTPTPTTSAMIEAAKDSLTNYFLEDLPVRLRSILRERFDGKALAQNVSRADVYVAMSVVSACGLLDRCHYQSKHSFLVPRDYEDWCRRIDARSSSLRWHYRADPETRRITELALLGSKSAGTLDTDPRWFDLPSITGFLGDLRSLKLSSCSSLPIELGELTELERLELGSTVSVPRDLELSHLTELVVGEEPPPPLRVVSTPSSSSSSSSSSASSSSSFITWMTTRLPALEVLELENVSPTTIDRVFASLSNGCSFRTTLTTIRIKNPSAFDQHHLETFLFGVLPNFPRLRSLSVLHAHGVGNNSNHNSNHNLQFSYAGEAGTRKRTRTIESLRSVADRLASSHSSSDRADRSASLSVSRSLVVLDVFGDGAMAQTVASDPSEKEALLEVLRAFDSLSSLGGAFRSDPVPQSLPPGTTESQSERELELERELENTNTANANVDVTVHANTNTNSNSNHIPRSLGWDSDVEWALRKNHAGRRLVNHAYTHSHACTTTQTKTKTEIRRTDCHNDNDDRPGHPHPSSGSRIPIALWPTILERASRPPDFGAGGGRCDSRSRSSFESSIGTRRTRETSTGVFYLLRDVGPRLFGAPLVGSGAGSEAR